MIGTVVVILSVITLLNLVMTFSLWFFANQGERFTRADGIKHHVLINKTKDELQDVKERLWAIEKHQ